ncbi:MAG: hypothetical protein CBD32_03140 [Actinobacteria bacterium TMED172]|nr:hypothetical protein [Cellvibrionales bacterium]OUW33459.1 MAG: hypothetical protein CBD32_03140 [Actinobacteria bacterium TMED172]|tara:strand:- start:10504 stop:11427 length:924 start_codon:yes stop_codon:yes gene_type:complete
MLNDKVLDNQAIPVMIKIFAGFCLLSAIFFLEHDASLANKIPLLVIFIALVGMPHGALDVMMIARLTQQSESMSGLLAGFNHSYWLRLFGCYLLYACVAGVAFSFWLVFPSTALILFLVMAVSHFRHDWQGFGGRLMQMSLAALVVTCPACFHADAIAEYFQALFLPDQAIPIIVVSMQSIAVSAILVALYAPKELSFSRLLVIAVVGISAFCLDPLLFFIAYFCSLHSLLHTLSIKDEFDLSWPQLMCRIVPPMLITLLLMGIVFELVPFQTVDTQWLRVIFIGLFALTIPHMLLTWHFQSATSPE